MTILKFIYRISWRQITIHLVATFFLIIAARQFVALNDIGIVNTIYKYGVEDGLKLLVKEDNFANRFMNYTYWNAMSILIGLVVAMTISLTLTIRKKMFWLNSLIVFIIALSLNWFGLYDNKVIDTIFFSFGKLFVGIGIPYKFIANGTLLTIIGIVIFFSKWTSNFAFKYRQTE